MIGCPACDSGLDMTEVIDPENTPGYRRRIAIEPAPGSVTAELEDDYHRMVVTLSHKDGVITAISSEMKRSPWTTCEGAMAVLQDTFVGKRLDDPSVKRVKSLNCTHLYDLASFCVAHASMPDRLTFDIFTSDPVDGVVCTRLYRNGERLLDWRLESGKFAKPEEVAGKGLLEINGWLAELDVQDPALGEAARILRWASMIAGGRAISMPAGMSGSAIGMVGTCHTFQPETAKLARRKPGADLDFSGDEIAGPMADREDLFAGF